MYGQTLTIVSLPPLMRMSRTGEGLHSDGARHASPPEIVDVDVDDEPQAFSVASTARAHRHVIAPVRFGGSRHINARTATTTARNAYGGRGPPVTSVECPLNRRIEQKIAGSTYGTTFESIQR